MDRHWSDGYGRRRDTHLEAVGVVQGPRTPARKARSSRNADKRKSFNRRIRSMNKEVAALVWQAKEIGHLFK
jgi:hypothetical protein